MSRIPRFRYRLSRKLGRAWPTSKLHTIHIAPQRKKRKAMRAPPVSPKPKLKQGGVKHWLEIGRERERKTERVLTTMEPSGCFAPRRSISALRRSISSSTFIVIALRCVAWPRLGVFAVCCNERTLGGRLRRLFAPQQRKRRQRERERERERERRESVL
jgi:hypothetical protein